jgi:hypothetical protein
MSAKYMIVAGFLAIATGRTRGTEDIDMVIGRMAKPAFVKIHDDLVNHGFVCMQSDFPETIYEDYLTKNRVYVTLGRIGRCPKWKLSLQKIILTTLGCANE